MSKHLKSGNNKKHFTLRPTRATVRISSVNIQRNEKYFQKLLRKIKHAETVRYMSIS